MCKKILLVGGGTGGHVFPLLNLVHYFQENLKTLPLKEGAKNSPLKSKEKRKISREYPQREGDQSRVSFHWIGESSSIESRVAQDNQIPFSPIVCGKLRRYFSLQTLLVPFQVLAGFFQSLWIINNFGATTIFSKGGYVSIPVALAGWVLRVPVYLHESDSVPGLANRIVGRFAKGIFCAFTEADSFFDIKKKHGHGAMLSQEIVLMNNAKGIMNNEGLLNTQILISCGSQGSSTIFDAVLELLDATSVPAPQFPNPPFKGEKNGMMKVGVCSGDTHFKGKEGVLAAELLNSNEKKGSGNGDFSNMDFHIILGVKNLDYREKFEKFPNVEIFDFFYDQTEYLKVVQKCDLVIARSGSSIFEFEALGLQMILIPHPHTGNNHQYWNAKAFEKKGHELLEQKNISELGKVLEKYKDFKKSPQKMVADGTIFDTIAQILFK